MRSEVKIEVGTANCSNASRTVVLDIETVSFDANDEQGGRLEAG